MSASRQPRFPGFVEAELDATGLPWGMVPGKKHWKVTIGGRLAFVVSRGGSTKNRRQWKNAVAEIRRAAREVREAKP